MRETFKPSDDNQPDTDWYSSTSLRLPRRPGPIAVGFLLSALIVVILLLATFPLWQVSLQSAILSGLKPLRQERPFDPNVGAVLPAHRVIAYYAVPGSEVTGPAYEPSQEMLTRLRQQGATYSALDPAHPVQLGLDLVVSVPDAVPGPDNTYSHHVDKQTIQRYIDFCQKNHLLLFLDLNFGQAQVMKEVNFFLPYLQRYSFVHMAVDPEWMFPRRDGIPGVNLSNVRASDLNPIIKALADIPMKYHMPRKILILHQYRPNGDGLADPFSASQAEIADKQKLINEKRVDVVLHVDSVGGYQGDHEDKQQQYGEWVKRDMKLYHNFRYGGFKLFYHIEAATGLMTPKEVLALDPAPMVITYGN